jgi:hypothetical protein
MEDSHQDEGFQIKDKRRFTQEGAVKEEQQAPKRETAEKEAPKPEEKVEAATETGREETREQPLPSLDFAGLILSLANTALFQLGFIRAPEGETRKDLAAARQTIDIIAMLERKTEGNLTEQEKRVVTETLFQLRMAFVEAAK